MAIKKIGKYIFLLVIKESYLFSRNLLGLFFHPFKTLKLILQDKDYSQVLLIFGLPFYIFIFGLMVIFGGRFLIQAPKNWGILAKTSLFLVFIFSLLIFVYLGYWLKKIKDLK